MYGCPVGSDRYVEHMLDIKVEEVARRASRVCQVLKGESQAIWCVLQLSMQQQFGYWLSLVHPTQVARAAARVDTILREVLEEVGGFAIPQEGGDLDYTCPMGPEVAWLRGRSFQAISSTLPIKSGGLGIRSQVDLSPAAWLGALEQALPDFSGEKGVCPPLAELSGSEEDDLHRWRPLLESGLRTGEELRRAWDTLQQRGSEMATFLGEELGGGPGPDCGGGRRGEPRRKHKDGSSGAAGGADPGLPGEEHQRVGGQVSQASGTAPAEGQDDDNLAPVSPYPTLQSVHTHLPGGSGYGPGSAITGLQRQIGRRPGGPEGGSLGGQGQVCHPGRHNLYSQA